MLALLLLMNGCAKHCGEDGPKIHEATKPIVEAIAAYAQEHGEPQSILDVDGISYKLIPCSEHLELYECNTLKHGYFFQFDEEYFSVEIQGWGGGDKLVSSSIGFWLKATHFNTSCTYTIYEDGKLKDNYLSPRCGALPNCGGGWKQ